MAGGECDVQIGHVSAAAGARDRPRPSSARRRRRFPSFLSVNSGVAQIESNLSQSSPMVPLPPLVVEVSFEVSRRGLRGGSPGHQFAL